MRISDWSSDVCSSDLCEAAIAAQGIERLVQWHPGEQAPAEHGKRTQRALEPFEPKVGVAEQRMGAADIVVHEIVVGPDDDGAVRSEAHTSELQSLMRLSYAVFCLKKNTKPKNIQIPRRRM